MIDVKTIRESTGLSQDKFAAEYGIPPKTLRNWEQGRTSPPKYVISMLAKVVGVGTGEPEPTLTRKKFEEQFTLLSGDAYEAYDEGTLSLMECAAMQKDGDARMLSKWGRHLTTYDTCLDRIPLSAYKKLNAADVAALVDAIQDAYSAGKADGERGKD